MLRWLRIVLNLHMPPFPIWFRRVWVLAILAHQFGWNGMYVGLDQKQRLKQKWYLIIQIESCFSNGKFLFIGEFSHPLIFIPSDFANVDHSIHIVFFKKKHLNALLCVLVSQVPSPGRGCCNDRTLLMASR